LKGYGTCNWTATSTYEPDVYQGLAYHDGTPTTGTLLIDAMAGDDLVRLADPGCEPCESGWRICGAMPGSAVLSVEGNEGADRLFGCDRKYPDDEDCAGGGVVIFGGSGADTIFGSYYADSLYGESGIDELHGCSGSDYLYGGTEGDSLSGEGGDDWFDGGVGTDTCTGNEGYDYCEAWYNYCEASDCEE
jgi:hypothetical protein